MSITIDLADEVESQVRQAAQSEGLEPNAYVTDILMRHLYKRSITTRKTESDLLQQINIGLSEESWERYHLLRAKLDDKTLTPHEQQELISITDRLEKANVRRVDALLKLAALRNTTVELLIDELKVRSPAYV